VIVVTGALGFIGSALVWDLNENGYDDILCVDLYRNGQKWKNLAKRNVFDVLSPDAFIDFLEDSEEAENIDAIFHMGACSSTTETNVDYLIENNFRYSQTLFQWCAQNNVPFFYASSAATYGAGDNGYDDQTDSAELRPLNPYGYSKVLFDRWVEQQEELPPRWYGLKFFNVYGPQEYHKNNMASVVYKAFHQINESAKLQLFKSHNPDYQDGKQLRDFVYVKEVTSWMIQFMDRRFKSGLYNMGFGQARTWLDLAESVFRAMDKPVNIEWIDMPENIRDQYQYFTQAKMDRAFAGGLSKPRWSLEEGIADYVKNYLMTEDKYL
jgi:ADP-L-glycero-D-manno-heptose 6-epimerase